MAEVVQKNNSASDASILNSSSQIQIAQLSPSITIPASIKAVVSLIWPYSSLNNSAALLLSEPDFRLRRERGQVRVRFSGSSGRAVACSGIGSGDLVTLSLEGVEWVKEDSNTTQTSGRGIEWEIRYAERVHLEICQEETQSTSIIDIDHPTLTTAEESTVALTAAASENLEPQIPFPRTRKVSDLEAENPEEWKSPAFIKRARTSYGSLFGSSDIFADDRSAKGKGRKRTSVGWRYTSQSPSPTPSEPEATHSGDALPQTPAMTDEGCQTNGNGEALIEMQHSGIEPFVASAGPPPGTPNPIQAKTVIDHSTPQTHSEDPTFQDIAKQQDWTAINVGPLDPRLTVDYAEPLSSISPAVVSTASFVHPHPEGDLYREDSVQNLPDQNALSDARDGFDDNNQPPSMDGFGVSDQYGTFKSEMAANDQLSDLISSHQSQEYPSPTHASIHDEEAHQRCPYYESDDATELLRNAANTEDELHTMTPPHPDQTRSRKPSMSSHRSYHSSTRHTPSLQVPQGSLSRSQSAPHEVFDLTGSSDEEMAADDEDGLGEDESVKEQANNDGWSNSSDAEGEEDDEADEYGHRIPSWRRELQAGIQQGQIYDNEDGYESDPQNYESGEDYDEESYDEDDEDDVDGAKHAAKGVPPVISLLSSDDEDVAEDIDEGDDSYTSAPKYSTTYDRKSTERLDSQYSEDEYSGGEDVDKRVESYTVAPKFSTFDRKTAENPNSKYARDEHLGESEEVGASDQSEEEDSDQPEVESIKSRDSSRFSKPGENDLPDEEGLGQPYLPLAQFTDQSANYQGERQPRLMSFDGAADPPDVKVIELHQIESSSPVRVIVEGDDSVRLTLGKKVRILDAAASKTSSPGRTDTKTKVIAVSERDKLTSKMTSSMKKPSPVDSVKAQILEIIMNKESITETIPLLSDHRDEGKEKGIQKKNTSVEKEVGDKTEFTVETEGIATEIPPTEELPENLGDVEMTDSPLYPQLPLNEAEEDQAEPHMDTLKPINLTLKNQQLPTPADTQMTYFASTTVSFEETRLSATENQETQVSSTASIKAIALVEPPMLLANDTGAADDAPTVFSFEASPPQVVKPVVNSDLNEDITGKEAINVKSKSTRTATKKVGMAIETHSIPEPPSLPVTPRRSQRQASKALNSPKLIVTPKKEPSLDQSISPAGYDASIELALASFDPPRKRSYDNSSATSVISTATTNLKSSLTTNHGEYTDLKKVRSLRFAHNPKVDILAIATVASRVHHVKRHPKDCLTDFHITDPSVNPGVVTRVAVFRPHLEALPVVDPGDGLLLRNFKVQSEKGAKFSVRSEGDSSWAVFKSKGGIEKAGPPVEFGDEESSHVTNLIGWFNDLSAAKKEEYQRAHARKAEKGKGV